MTHSYMWYSFNIKEKLLENASTKKRFNVLQKRLTKGRLIEVFGYLKMKM